MIITAVVFRNNINKPLSDGPIQSIMVHKQLMHICRGGGGGGGGGGKWASHHNVTDRKVTGGKQLPKLGYHYPNEIFLTTSHSL